LVLVSLVGASPHPAAQTVWTIAVAGDISCPRGPEGTTSCRDRATSNVILADASIDRSSLPVTTSSTPERCGNTGRI
jgi:hypothetical protein